MSQKDLFSNFLNGLLSFFSKKGNILTVYAHNLSGFDGIFLMKHLLSYGKVKPLIFNGRLMCIELKLEIKGYNGRKIIFKDSYLLLPYSLRKLCEAFNITLTKGWFPYKLTDIFYKGIVPSINYWNISIQEYEALIKEFTGITWSFKDEAIKYCKLDCFCLYEILVKFNENVFNKFQINIHSSLTAPALSMRIFKTHFMPENTIYQLLGKIEKDIRESYTGGAVDVYKPHNKIGSYFSKTFRKLYYYDVNSLYPTVMAQGEMPIGLPTIFEGDIRKIDSNAYGFFYCKITTPAYLEHPILQRIIKTSEGTRTIAGLGSWTGWISSIEMDAVIKLGYTFEIIKGYQFEKGNLFNEYINRMYNLRLEYPKGHPMNLIAKLMMNSLYGKFGMKNELTVVDIFKINDESDKTAFEKLIDLWGNSIHDWVISDNYVIVIRDKTLDIKTESEPVIYHGTDINIAIASAITSYARGYMSFFKNNSLFNLYYSDTDSIVIDRPLSDSMVGNALGQLKLEFLIEKAVFLAPKVYALITDSGEEIVKVKGLKHDVISKLHFSDLEALLIQDSTREFNQEKWFKSVIKGEISTSNEIYTLKVTSNKREQIYIDGIYTNTKPFNYEDIQIKDA